MNTVPLQAVPAQQVKIVLNNQNCQISVYLKKNWLFVDLNADGVETFIGALARNANFINPCKYKPFNGDLLFIDTQGNDDPVYTGLGSRFQLIYFTGDEVANLVSE